MARAIIIAFVVFLSLSQDVVGQRRDSDDRSNCFQTGLSFPNVYQGWIYVCPSDVRRDPKWDEGAGKRVPLEVHEAVRKSRSELQAFDPNEKRWRLDGVSLVKVDDEHCVYRVDWTVPDANKGLAMVVTLSGKVIQPKLEQRP